MLLKDQIAKIAGGLNKSHQRSGSGKLVKTKSGILGRTFNDQPLANGKVCVYLSGGRKMLCKSKSLKLIGFID